MTEYVPQLEDRVACQDDFGTIKYIGKIQGIKGIWIGLRLDEPKGKNNGMAKGKRYFTCPDKHGLFCKKSMIRPLVRKKSHKPSTMSKSMTEYVPQLEDRVSHQEGLATIKYIGKITGIKGTWIGLELDEPKGKNNGMAK